jgi:hypothetical protein
MFLLSAGVDGQFTQEGSGTTRGGQAGCEKVQRKW